MAKDRQRLNVDLDSLFPGDTVKVGDQQIILRPLGILQIAVIAKKLKGFATVMSEEGVTFENFSEPENIITIAATLLGQFPEVLEEITDIHIDDINTLPVEIIIEILDKIVDVNIKSKEGLEKNFNSLIGKFANMVTNQAKNVKAPKHGKIKKK